MPSGRPRGERTLSGRPWERPRPRWRGGMVGGAESSTRANRGIIGPVKTSTTRRKGVKKKAPSSAHARSRTSAKKKTVKKHGPRADFGAPVDGFFAKQPPHLRAILEELRTVIEKTVPAAT